MNLVNLGLIKELRSQKGYTIEQMSRLIGKGGYNAYYYKENGTRKLTSDDVALIATALGVTIDSLFFKDKISKMVTERMVM